MFIKNIFCLYSNSTILKGFVVLFLVPLVFSNIFYNKVEENILNQYSTVDPSMKSSNLLMFDIHKNNGHRSSTREQIRTYKLNRQNVLLIKLNEKTKKNTGIFTLHSLSIQNNDNNTNNTNNPNYKSKNILFQKLDCINKKLKNTIKQLQATTTKSFINFNFTYTQQKDFSEILSSPTTSATATNPLYITNLKNNNQIKEQKDSKGNNDSSIPKSYIDYLKYSSNNKIKMDSPSTVNNEIQSSLNMNSNMNKNKNKSKNKKTNKNKKNAENINEKSNQEIVQRKKSTLGKNTCEIQFTNTNLDSYFTLYNIPTSKSTMELNRRITSNSSSATTSTTSIEFKEEESKFKKGIINEPILENNNNKNKNQVNETESKKETIENEDQSLENFILENNLFSSPAGMALILFILYATFMF